MRCWSKRNIDVKLKDKHCLHPIASPRLCLFLLYNLPASCALAARARSRVILSVPLNRPVKDIVILVTFADEQVPEQFAEVRIIWLVVKAQSTTVVEEDSKLVREATAKKVRGGSHFLLHDTIVLLLLRGSLEALPREGAT